MESSRTESSSGFCPDEDFLARAAQGMLSDDDLDRLTDHLNSCPGCMTRIDEMISNRHEAPLGDEAGGTPTSGSDPEFANADSRVSSTGPRLGDRFGIIRKLGTGGMGEVYECHDRNLHRRVAVKKIRPAIFDPELMQRLQTEARIQSRLNHPGIVQIYEVGQRAGIPFLVMELVPGRSLKEILSLSPLPPWRAALIVMQLARALHFAHQNRVIHRDLKPSNILLTDESCEFDTQPSSAELQRLNSSVLAKIADFGLAKILDESSHLTRSEMIVGTPAYLAPEQANSRKLPITAAADIYALGVVLYECLTGHPPFESHSLSMTLAMIESMTPISPRDLSPGISRDLETICLKCLEKSPEKRYESALALAEDLNRYSIGMPILARPVSQLQVFYRWCKRNRSTAAAIGFAGLSLVALTTGSLYYANREAELRRIALTEADKSRQAETAARQAEAAARQAEAEARVESDHARNNLFAGLSLFEGIRKKLEPLEDPERILESVRAINLESKNTIDTIIRNYLNRPNITGEPKGAWIDRLFLDGIAMRDFGEHEKALAIFERLFALARDCPPDHPDRLRRRAAACRSATVMAILMGKNYGDKAKAIRYVEEAWKSWPIDANDPGVTVSMLYDRSMVCETYARLLRETGRATEAEAVEKEARRIETDRLRLFPPNPQPASQNRQPAG